MLNFIIKTHQKNKYHKEISLFLLNKEMNSSKPQKEPFTNSFVIIIQDEKKLENLY